MVTVYNFDNAIHQENILDFNHVVNLVSKFSPADLQYKNIGLPDKYTAGCIQENSESSFENSSLYGIFRLCGWVGSVMSHSWSTNLILKS